jgi:pilus assembly protein CpaB
MNLKKVLPLTAALVMGLIAARLVVQMSHKKTADAQVAPQTVKVVSAAHDVAPGDALNGDAMTVSEVGADSAPANSFSDPGELGGRVALSTITKGQTIVESLLAPKGTASGLQAVIPPGMRAVTIDINEVSGVAGFVTPGSRVDLLEPIHDDQANQFVSRCLVQNVLVSAVGTRPLTSVLDTSAAHSVTLIVTPKQAQLIDLAAMNGHARLVLRSANDNTREDIPPLSMDDVLGTRKPTPQVVVQTPAAKEDPFAGTTRPSMTAVANSWQVRVISAGETSTVDIHTAPTEPSVTGTDRNLIGDH